jgi:glyoxylase-like metal-dependent hydrolase (beta-lactamase superfamily II)
VDAGEAARHRVSEHVLGDIEMVTIMTGAPWRENCHLLIDAPSRRGLLVDPGDCAEAILAEIARRDVTVEHVALTHGHHDHVGAVAPVCRHLGLPCEVHAGDLRLLRQAPLWAFRFSGRKIEPPAPVRPLDLGGMWIGGTRVEILATPGHTAGGVCLLVQGAALTGDTILYEHIGRTDLPGADAEALHRSVDSLLDTIAGDTILFSGHGRPWVASQARAWWSAVRDAPPVLDEQRDLS